MPGHLIGGSLTFILELQNPPFNSLLGIYPKDSTSYSRDTCSNMFIAAVVTVTRRGNLLTCPSTDKWTRKLWYTHTMAFYSAVRKNDIVKFTGKWMNMEKNYAK